jgi:hypothetical protein
LTGAVVLVPVVEIVLGSSKEQEGFGRVKGIAVDERQRVYVFDVLASTVRVFDKAGRHIRNIGRKGGGPGEFSRPHGSSTTNASNAIAISHDTLFVIDRSLQAFDTAGNYLSSSRGVIEFEQAGSISASPDGLVVVTKPSHLATTEQFVFSLYDFKRPEKVGDSFSVTEQYMDYKDGISRPILPNPMLIFHVAADGLTYFVVGDTFHIDVRDIDGDVRTTLVSNVPKVPVTRTDMDEFVTTFVTRVGDDLPMVPPEAFKARFEPKLRKALSRRPVATAREAVGSMVVSDKGSILISRPDLSPHPYRALATDELEWVLLHPNGSVSARLKLPTRFMPKLFRGCMLYGIGEDNDGNPLVLRYNVSPQDPGRC